MSPFVRPPLVRLGDRLGARSVFLLLLGVLFSGVDPDTCEDACDANDDGGQDISDAITTLAFLFTSGPSPSAPYPDCAADPTFDGLNCLLYICP